MAVKIWSDLGKIIQEWHGSLKVWIATLLKVEGTIPENLTQRICVYTKHHSCVCHINQQNYPEWLAVL